MGVPAPPRPPEPGLARAWAGRVGCGEVRRADLARQGVGQAECGGGWQADSTAPLPPLCPAHDLARERAGLAECGGGWQAGVPVSAAAPLPPPQAWGCNVESEVLSQAALGGSWRVLRMVHRLVVEWQGVSPPGLHA